MTEHSTADARTVSVASLGGPGEPDPARCSAAAIDALSAAAGPGLGITSLALDLSSQALGGGEARICTWIDKRTKSIVFVSTEARIGERLVFSAQGLFSRRSSRP